MKQEENFPTWVFVLAFVMAVMAIIVMISFANKFSDKSPSTKIHIDTLKKRHEH